MANARVIAVSTGRVKAAPAMGGTLGWTAIDKRPSRARVRVVKLGLDGDEQADKVNHGGYEQAVYAYAREDLDWWVEQLGRELRDGMFGENITTAGLDISGAAIGETWRLGTAVVQVTSPRVPCVTFAGWLGEDHWVRRFAQAGPAPTCGCSARARSGQAMTSRSWTVQRSGSRLPSRCSPSTATPVSCGDCSRLTAGGPGGMRSAGRSLAGPRSDEPARPG